MTWPLWYKCNKTFFPIFMSAMNINLKSNFILLPTYITLFCYFCVIICHSLFYIFVEVIAIYNRNLVKYSEDPLHP